MMQKTVLQAEKQFDIRFSEVDSMGIVWHGSYVAYLEDAREAFGAKYHLEYLNEPEFTPSNKHPEYEGMQLNYVMMLSHLIPFYRADGEKEKALWLQQLLTDVINNTQVNENFKRHCFQILDENTNLDENTK